MEKIENWENEIFMELATKEMRENYTIEERAQMIYDIYDKSRTKNWSRIHDIGTITEFLEAADAIVKNVIDDGVRKKNLK